MTKLWWTLCGVVCVCVCACSRSQPKPGATSAPSTGAPAASSVAASEGGAPAAKEKAGPAGTYAGEYAAKAGSVYIPKEKDWANVKWKGDDGGLTGKGELSLVIGDGGRVEGSSKGGPLGDAIITGALFDGVLTATVSRKDPSDEGLTGTLHAKLDADALTGTMRLSGAHAQKVREASFTLKKK